MNRIVFFLLIFTLLCAGTCKKNPFFKSVLQLSIDNKSSKVLAAYYSLEYPDTTIVANYEKHLFGIPPNKKVGDDYSDKKWSDVFARTPKDTLSVFIFSGDTVAAYSWDEIRSGYKVLKRLDLSQSDLEAMNYTVTYP